MKRIYLLIPILVSIILLTPVNGSNTIEDKQITMALENELLFNATTPSYLIDVNTYDGIVTLSGEVNNILAKERASKIARSLKGVRGVINKIEVDAPTFVNKNLEKKINNAFIKDPATDSWEIDVKAQSGNITLSGSVDSWQEKQLAAYVAKNVIGVKSVKNDITIDYGFVRADFEIKNDIEQMFRNDIRIDDGLINVDVTDAKVHLSGIVGSANEKALALANAWSIGVVEVDVTNLEIKDWARNKSLRENKYVVKTENEIKEAVKDALLFDPRVNSFNPEIDVNNSTVILSGTVSNLKAKKAAEMDARNIVGVARVRNFLKVRPSTIPENSKLEAALSASLDLDPVVELWDIEVKASEGTVYLNGNVDSYFEKYKAEDIASRTRGVINVENNLNVYDNNDYFYTNYYGWNSIYPPYQIDVNTAYKSDNEIRDEIESQLWWSPYVNEDEITVVVENGKAILIGTVDTQREKLFAEINAMEGGAKSIENKLKISNNSN